jgi:hypothetical protein
LLLAALAVLLASDAEPAGYRLLKTIPVPGDAGRRGYVSHGNKVDVLDADSDDIKGRSPR